MKLTVTLLLIAFLLLAAATGVRAQEFPDIREEYPELNLPILEAKFFPENPIRVTAECSTLQPRAVDAVIEWVEDQPDLKAYRLDVTLFKNGFEQEWYATLWPIREQNRTRPINPERLGGERAVSGLSLSVVSLSGTEAGTEPFRLRLTGLDPGKNYYWRILKRDRKGWIAGEVIRVQAPVCPADIIREN